MARGPESTRTYLSGGKSKELCGVSSKRSTDRRGDLESSAAAEAGPGGQTGICLFGTGTGVGPVGAGPIESNDKVVGMEGSVEEGR
jgi:hypothetical protein